MSQECEKSIINNSIWKNVWPKRNQVSLQRPT